MIIKNKCKEAFKRIKKAHNILLVTHLRPDGDALSSVCAMIDLMETCNKKYIAFCQDEPAQNFSFIPHIEKIVFDKKKINNILDFDLIITLDCGSMQRTGLTVEINELIVNRKGHFIIEFDHHPGVDDFSDLEIRKPEAAATTEILYDFLKVNKIKITKNMANCILTGILTDTSNFLYPSTSKKTIDIASETLIYGAKFPQITKETHYNKNLSSMKLWGVALKKIRINKKYNFAFSVLTKQDMGDVESNENIFDAIAGFLGNLHKVKGVMFLREEDGHIKGSLRSSHPNIDISKLAKVLGGGGHPKASGFLIEGQIIYVKNIWKII